MKITKQMVLEGFSHRLEVPAPEYGADVAFTVAPPTASEVSEAKALRMRLSEVKTGEEPNPSEIDLSKALIAEEAARRFLIAKALTRGMGEEWTVEDVEKIHPRVLERLWEAVDTLTGFTGEAEEAIRNFRRRRKAERS